MVPNSTRRRYLAVIGSAVGSLLVAGCGSGGGGDGDGGGGGPSVDMTDDLVFDPDEITISTGETLVWENAGSVGHSVTAYEDEIPDDAAYFASGGFDGEQAAREAYSVGDPDSGDVLGGESYEHTFEVAGTYEYFCIPHESAGMTGTVVVQ